MNQTETIKLLCHVILILLGASLWIRFTHKKLKEVNKKCDAIQTATIAWFYALITPMAALGLCFGSTAVVNVCEYLITGKIT